MRSLFFFSCMMCYAQSPTAAPQYGLPRGKFELGIAGGGIRQNVSPDDGYKPAITLSLADGFTEKLAIGFRITAASYNNNVFVDAKGPYATKATLSLALGEARYEFRQSCFAPFLAGGFGGLGFTNISTTLPGIAGREIIADLGLRNGWQAAGTIGAGINASLSSKVVLEFAVRGIKAQHTQWFYNPTIGLLYRFK